MENEKHICTFCGKVIEKELVQTEDAEYAHSDCLESYNKYWDDRTETINLIGW